MSEEAWGHSLDQKLRKEHVDQLNKEINKLEQENDVLTEALKTLVEACEEVQIWKCHMDVSKKNLGEILDKAINENHVQKALEVIDE